MEHDLTTEQGVVALMKTSRSETDWNANCDRVKAANVNPQTGRPDYPPFWYAAIVLSGVAQRALGH